MGPKGCGYWAVCRTSCGTMSTSHPKIYLAPKIKCEPQALGLFFLPCTTAIESPHCRCIKRELDSTCFWKLLLHMLLLLVTGGFSFPLNIWVGFTSPSPQFFSFWKVEQKPFSCNRWETHEQNTPRPPGAQHRPAGNARGWMLVQGAAASSSYCSISKPKQPCIVKLSLQLIY